MLGTVLYTEDTAGSRSRKLQAREATMTENHTVQGLICSVMSSDLPFLHDYGRDRREEEEAYAPSTASMCVKMSSCKDKVRRILTRPSTMLGWFPCITGTGRRRPALVHRT